MSARPREVVALARVQARRWLQRRQKRAEVSLSGQSQRAPSESCVGKDELQFAAKAKGHSGQKLDGAPTPGPGGHAVVRLGDAGPSRRRHVRSGVEG